MLIYHTEDNQLFVTQIIRGYNTSDITTHKTSVDKAPTKHKPFLKYLAESKVYVTGDASVAGDGIKNREDYLYLIEGV